MTSSLQSSIDEINVDRINIDFDQRTRHDEGVTTYVRAPEAARILGVSHSTLYAYVSRGRVSRVRAADGRTSLFAVDELDAVRASGRRNDQAPRPTIDVQIASAITKLGDDGVELRGYPLTSLLAEHSFEDVAELLIAGALPAEPVTWPGADPDDRSGGHLDPAIRAGRADRPARRSPRRCSVGSTPTTTRRPPPGASCWRARRR